MTLELDTGETQPGSPSVQQLLWAQVFQCKFPILVRAAQPLSSSLCLLCTLVTSAVEAAGGTSESQNGRHNVISSHFKKTTTAPSRSCLLLSRLLCPFQLMTTAPLLQIFSLPAMPDRNHSELSWESLGNRRGHVTLCGQPWFLIPLTLKLSVSCVSCRQHGV